MQVSVIICTYNRANILKDAILSIHGQDFPVDEFELIIVDNNSNDNTKELVNKMITTAPCKMTYIFERQQGLSYARNTGLKYAQGDLVAFTDDDGIADVSWLSSLVSAFEKSDVCAVGGPIQLLWPLERPPWLTDALLWPLAVTDSCKFSKLGEYVYPDCPTGANMAFRRDIIVRFEGFCTDLGRVGDNLISCEEVDLFRRMAQAGLTIKFDPLAIVSHKIAPERLTKEWFLRRFTDEGKSNAIMDLLDKKESTFNRIKWHVDIFSCAWQNNRFVNDCYTSLVIGYCDHIFLSDDERASFDGLNKRILTDFIQKIAESMHSTTTQLQSTTAQLQSSSSQLKNKTEELSYLRSTLIWKLASLYYKYIDKMLPQGARRRIPYDYLSRCLHAIIKKDGVR